MVDRICAWDDGSRVRLVNPADSKNVSATDNCVVTHVKDLSIGARTHLPEDGIVYRVRLLRPSRIPQIR